MHHLKCLKDLIVMAWHDHSTPHLCSMGLDRPSFLSPGSAGETSRSAHSRCRSQKQPDCPSESCCRLCGRTLETRGSHTSLALGEHKHTTNGFHKVSWTALSPTWTLVDLHLVTCAVFAVSAVRVDTGAGVGALRVLTTSVFITVRSQSTLIHICTHTHRYFFIFWFFFPTDHWV